MKAISQRTLDARIIRGPWPRLVTLAGICGVGIACSSSNNPGSTGSAVGGANSVGGSTHATGGSSSNSTNAGASSVGGQAGAAQGGSSATGGATATGGAPGGTGAATGGSPAGTGGAATGGTPAGTGGSAIGGAATGGAATGGAVTGGAATGGAATGGAATGGAATGGTSSCAAATFSMISSSDYQLKVCDVTLDVNPQIGARVTYLKLGSTDIITPFTCTTYNSSSTTCSNNAGSTFWTSPQTAWGWPPVAAIDGNTYTPTLNGSQLTLKGSADATLGAGVTKVISGDSSTGWISLTYTINATKPIQAAPWQITRVPRGGLVFFPLMSLVSNTTNPLWFLSPSNGYEWIDDSTQATVTNTNGAKVIADGGVSGQSYTWLAYVLNRNLLLIKYTDVLTGSFAPGEADTEVYPGSGYIELEAQGAYASIAANASSAAWTVQWKVVAIPSTITTVAAGSTPLATFAQQQAAL